MDTIQRKHRLWGTGLWVSLRLLAIGIMFSSCDSSSKGNSETVDTGSEGVNQTDSADSDTREDDTTDTEDSGVDITDAGDTGDTGGDTTDTETDSNTTDFENTVSISDFGAVELAFNMDPIENPVLALTNLADIDPAYTSVLGSQTLPEAGTEIRQLDRVLSYTSLNNVDALADELQIHGVVKSSLTYNREVMNNLLIDISGNYYQPGVFITADVLFSTFHSTFDNLLLGIEVRSLIPLVQAMVSQLKAASAMRYNSLADGPTKDAALDVVAYLQVAESLLDSSAPVVVEVAPQVSTELARIEAHAGLDASTIFDRPAYSDELCTTECHPCGHAGPEDLPFCGIYNEETEVYTHCPERFCEDYTQYVPRGHYTYNEALERYFKAVMWLGRMTWLNKSDQSTRGAVVLLDGMKSSEVSFLGSTYPTVQLWQEFFKVVSTFLGGTDDLNIAEVDGAVLTALESFAGTFSLSDLDDAAEIDVIQAAVSTLRDPAIANMILHSAADVTVETKGMRLLGQIYLPDSEVLGNVVWDNTGPDAEKEGWEEVAPVCEVSVDADTASLTVTETNCVCTEAFSDTIATPLYWDLCNGMPSGLDVAAALSGNEDIVGMATAQSGGYAEYNERLNELIDMFGGFGLDKWSSSVAWTWLYALRGLLTGNKADLPPFMRTDRWNMKQLETGLGAWAQLRHDTILYVEQTYTYGDADSDADGDIDVDTEVPLYFDYVEPQPMAYSRLSAAAQRLYEMIDSNAIFADSSQVTSALYTLQSQLARATEISVKELEGETLEAADIYWIRFFGSNSERAQNNLLTNLGIMDDNEQPDPDRLKITSIADVHTWGAKETVLEVGNGYVDTVVAVHRLPTGQWGVAVGPILSYREFEHPITDRLTDEAWREMLAADPEYGSPEWLDGP